MLGLKLEGGTVRWFTYVWSCGWINTGARSRVLNEFSLKKDWDNSSSLQGEGYMTNTFEDRGYGA